MIAGAQRDEDDVAPDVVEPGEDRGGVAPDADDAADVAAGLIGRNSSRRTVGGRERRDRLRAASATAGPSLPGLARGGGRERRVVGASRPLRRARWRRRPCHRAGGSRRGGCSPVPVSVASCCLERASPVRPAARSGRSPSPGVGVDECPHRGRVTADDVVERRRREVSGHHDRLGGRRDPDEGQERAVYEDEQERAAEAGRRSEHRRRYPLPLAGHPSLGETGQRPHGPNVASPSPDRSGDWGMGPGPVSAPRRDGRGVGSLIRFCKGPAIAYSCHRA